MPKLILKDESDQIVGAAMDVSNELGCGFYESVYQEAMELELRLRGVPVVSQPRVQISYKGRTLEKVFWPDMPCYNLVIVELKVLPRLGDPGESQLLNYLKATRLPLGLLLNFGNPDGLEWKRFVGPGAA
jgi:GxxExxY protein